MSFLSSTVGAVFRAATGHVDPWTVREIKSETRKDIKRAGSGLPPGTVEEAQRRADAEIDGHLKQIDAHPDQAGLRIPGLGKVGSPEFLKRLQSLVIFGFAGIALVFFARALIVRAFRGRERT